MMMGQTHTHSSAEGLAPGPRVASVLSSLLCHSLLLVGTSVLGSPLPSKHPWFSKMSCLLKQKVDMWVRKRPRSLPRPLRRLCRPHAWGAAGGDIGAGAAASHDPIGQSCVPSALHMCGGWEMRGAGALFISCYPFCSPTEAPDHPEPEETVTPLMEGAAWLHAYFREPTALQELPVPALHHPLFLQGQYLRRGAATSLAVPYVTVRFTDGTNAGQTEGTVGFGAGSRRSWHGRQKWCTQTGSGCGRAGRFKREHIRARSSL